MYFYPCSPGHWDWWVCFREVRAEDRASKARAEEKGLKWRTNWDPRSAGWCTCTCLMSALMRCPPTTAGLASLSDALIAPLIEEEGRGDGYSYPGPLDRLHGREPDKVWSVPFFRVYLETGGQGKYPSLDNLHQCCCFYVFCVSLCTHLITEMENEGKVKPCCCTFNIDTVSFYVKYFRWIMAAPGFLLWHLLTSIGFILIFTTGGAVVL